MRPMQGSLAFCVLFLMLGGCATYNKTKPAPQLAQPVRLDFSDIGLSGWTDLPPGTYRVPNSQVIVSGHQKGGSVGILFGVIGVLAESAINSSAGKDATKNAADVLHITLTAEARDAASVLLTDPQFAKQFTVAAEPAAPRLQVSTAVIMTFENDTDVLPFVELKVSLFEPKVQGAKWTTRYIASMGAARPLEGDKGWTSDGGKDLHNTISRELERALRVMLVDVATPFPRDEHKLTSVEGHFPFLKQRVQAVGYEITEDEQSISFIPKLGDVAVMAGVNIMDKSAVVYRSATQDDPKFKLLKD